MKVRNTAKDRGKPYWVWLQADTLRDPETGIARGRWPSESDIRVQAFSHLAVGYTGFIYFKYHTGYIWDYSNNTQGVGYDIVSKLNLELNNLGKVLKNLEHIESKVIKGTNASWNCDCGITEYDMNEPLYFNNGFREIQNVTGIGNPSKEVLLLSIFRDPNLPFNNQNLYFLITVLNHADNKNAYEKRLNFTMFFDGWIETPNGNTKPITELLFLDNDSCFTKHEYLEHIDDNRYKMDLELEVGSRLFKFDNGDFPVSLTELDKSNTKIPIHIYPNPAKGKTNISFELLKSGRVKVLIFDSYGRLLETVLNEYLLPGNQNINWNSNTLDSGIYFCKVVSNTEIGVSKFLISN